jgi:hypothetical protein
MIVVSFGTESDFLDELREVKRDIAHPVRITTTVAPKPMDDGSVGYVYLTKAGALVPVGTEFWLYELTEVDPGEGTAELRVEKLSAALEDEGEGGDGLGLEVVQGSRYEVG